MVKPSVAAQVGHSAVVCNWLAVLQLHTLLVWI
jgi:hypothetical protein